MGQAVTIKQLQEIYLGMMNAFHRFCTEKGLTYYMVGGTLLGAVREKGFIPWDDDVDFAMPRPDYERLIREYSGEMVLQSMHGEEKFFFPYTKLFHGETPVLEIVDDMHVGCSEVFVKIDVYPIDGVGNDRKTALALMEQVRRRKNLLYLNLTSDKSPNPLKNMALTIIRWIPSQWILHNIDKKMQSYSVENSSLWTRWREGGGVANLVNKDVFGDAVLLSFEDYSFFAPHNYSEYLMKVYGDYMVEKRENSGLRHDIGYNDLTKKFAQELKCEQNVNGGGGVILLDRILVKQNRVDFDYTITSDLAELFASDTKFFYEYLFDFDCSAVPESILNVPFVMNLMPLIWLSDSVLHVKVLDKQFYDCLVEIKNGLQRVYPKVKFGGKLLVDALEENCYESSGKSTIFFTGGVDATASLINNLPKAPQPFYILGADVDLRDTYNIAAAQRDISQMLEGFGFTCSFIRSSIRYFYNGVKITNFFEKQLKDSWWHGAQHSIGMLSLMAPYAYVAKIDTCILAASFTKDSEGKINCVSFPFIDNALRFGSTECYHDGYEMTRQDKVHLIADYGRQHNIDMKLRVCFTPQNGFNCNHCEKCMRTIMALTAAEADPNRFGFKVDHGVYTNIHSYLSTHLLYHTAHWKAIRAEYRKDRAKWVDNSDVSWILRIRYNSFKIYWKIFISKIKRILAH